MAASTAPVVISPLTQYMANVYDDTTLKAPSMGFQAFFARNNPMPTYVWDQRGFSYDIIRGSKTISGLVPRKTAARNIGSTAKPNVEMKFQNHAFVFPTAVETASADWDQTLERVAGEDPFGSLTREQRFGILLAKGGMESMRRIAGRIEKMAVESLTLGTVTLDDGQAYDFDRASTNTFAAPLVWTNASATPLVDLDNLARVITQNGGVPPDFVVFGRETFSAFINNPNVSGPADNRRYYFVEAGDNRSISALPPSLQWMVDAGFQHLGNCRTPEGRDFPIFNYLAQYQNDALSTWTDYFDTKGVFMGYSEARVDRYFGPSLTIPPSQFEQQNMMQKLGVSINDVFELPSGPSGVLDPRMFNWDFDIPQGAQTSALLRTHTSPLYIPTAIDMFGKITGVVA